jgi:hypothetical protein
MFLRFGRVWSMIATLVAIANVIGQEGALALRVYWYLSVYTPLCMLARLKRVAFQQKSVYACLSTQQFNINQSYEKHLLQCFGAVGMIHLLRTVRTEA